MRHSNSLHKLGVDRDLRKSLLRGLARSVVLHERIETTVRRAKEAQPLVDRLITLGRAGDLSARRNALSILPDEKVVGRLFAEIAPRYAGRAGGYTRILRTRDRKGDGAELCYLELVERRVEALTEPSSTSDKPLKSKEAGAAPAKPSGKKKKQQSAEPGAS